MNLEDAPGEAGNPLVDLPMQLEKIHAVREASGSLRVPLVLNARTDVYLLQLGDPAERYDETVRRLCAYRDAGADCVFAPACATWLRSSGLRVDVKCPLNILAGPGSPSSPQLRALGVARVSLGSGPMRAAMGLFAASLTGSEIQRDLRISGRCAHARRNESTADSPRD